MKETAPIHRLSLHDAAVNRLREMIVQGALRPGDRINERELVALFGVSRTPLREALKVLAAEGLVELLPHRGARVALFSSGEVQCMFDVMGALEGLAGELAGENITDDDLRAIEARHQAMSDAYERRDIETYYAQNEAIHEAILAAARNPLLSNVYHGLSARIRRLRYAANMSQERWVRAMREHEAMLAALRMRDGPGLAAILRAHARNKCEVVVANFAHEEAAGKAAG